MMIMMKMIMMMMLGTLLGKPPRTMNRDHEGHLNHQKKNKIDQESVSGSLDQESISESQEPEITKNLTTRASQVHQINKTWSREHLWITRNNTRTLFRLLSSLGLCQRRTSQQQERWHCRLTARHLHLVGATPHSRSFPFTPFVRKTVTPIRQEF